MQKRLDNHYKSCDVLDGRFKDKRSMEVLNEYGYNFDLNTKRRIDYEKSCSRVYYNDVKMRNIKGKR